MEAAGLNALGDAGHVGGAPRHHDVFRVGQPGFDLLHHMPVATDEEIVEELLFKMGWRGGTAAG